MDILRRQNEYKVFLADSAEKDNKELEKEKHGLQEDLDNLRNINSIVDKLAKVENKA